MESSTHLNDEETLVYNIIRQETKVSGGIPLSKLREREELKSIQTRRLSAIVNKLVKAKLIRKLAIDDNGYSSYLLQAVEQEETRDALNLDILSIPCYGCRNLYMCGEGRAYNPLKCPYLTRFLIEKSNTSES